jgi:hypothetical protein
MVREPDATMQLASQNIQSMSKHRVFSFKPQLRLEWRGQDGQSEIEQPNHSASLGDSITSSTRMKFSVQTGIGVPDAEAGYDLLPPCGLNPSSPLMWRVSLRLRPLLR